MTHPGRIYTLPTLHLKGVPWHPNTVRKKIKKHEFPAPDFFLGECTPAWTDRTLDGHFEQLAAAHARGEDAEVQAHRREMARAAARQRKERAAQSCEGEPT